MAPAVGSLLRWIASLTQPAQVLELGTGTGVSTGWLLAGLPAASVVTSVDADPALHSIARRTVAAMDHAAHRCRFIAGDATDVITRLTEGSYALVVLMCVCYATWNMLGLGFVVGGKRKDFVEAAKKKDDKHAEERFSHPQVRTHYPFY